MENNAFILFKCLVDIHLEIEIEVTADVWKSLTQAAIVPQKITKKTIVVKDPSINTNQKNQKNIHAIITQVIIRIHQTVLTQTIVIIHENINKLFIEVQFYIDNVYLCKHFVV